MSVGRLSDLLPVFSPLQIVAIMLFLAWLVKQYWPLITWENRPPGPWIFPLSGSIFAYALSIYKIGSLKEATKFPHRVIHNISQIYGPVMTLGMGTDVWVILSGLEEIKQFCMYDETTFRPDFRDLSVLYSFDRPLGVIFPDGPLWKEQRRFMSRTVREFSQQSSGRKGSKFEQQIRREVHFCAQLIDETMKESGSLERTHDFFNLPCLNVIWRLVCGRRFSYTDPLLPKVIKHIEAFTLNNIIGPIAAMPYLKKVRPFKQMYQGIKGRMDMFKMFLRQVVNEERLSFGLASQSADGAGAGDGDGAPNRGYVDAFLRAQMADVRKHLPNGHNGHNGVSNYTDEQLMISLEDFFTGGSGTVSKTLAYAVYLMAEHPEAQQRMHNELAEYVKNKKADVDADEDVDEDDLDVPISMCDRDHLPYTDAFLLETHRLSSVLPVAPPRVPSKDVRVGDYVIKKGTKVQVNIYSLHRNEKHWNEPNAFNPGRFLTTDEDGTTRVVMDEWLQPFGYGKRKCIGETMAKMTAFLFLANLCLRFRFSKPPGAPDVKPEPVGGLTIGPQEFAVKAFPY